MNIHFNVLNFGILGQVFLTFTCVVVLSSNISAQIDSAKTYYDNGSVKSKLTYISQDSSFLRVDYHLNGLALKLTPLKSDGYTVHGTQSGFNPDGSVAYYLNYLDGIPHGDFIELYPNGKLKRTGQLYRGFKNSHWAEFDSAGVATRRTTYTLSATDSALTSHPLDRLERLSIIYADMPIAYYVQGKLIVMDSARCEESIPVSLPQHVKEHVIRYLSE